jgi:hypothetical protein
MPDPGSPWERENPSDGFGYLPFPIRTEADEAKWKACAEYYRQREIAKGRPA